MDDRARINALLDEMAKLQEENNTLRTYTELLEDLLGVVHLDKPLD